MIQPAAFDTAEKGVVWCKTMASNFYDMLDAIGRRPVMYIDPSQSITALYNFIQGYQEAVGLKTIASNTQPSYAEFNNWVAMKLNFFESTKGWRRMLLEREKGSEEKAFARFFVLLDQFRNRKETLLFRAKVPNASAKKTKRLEIVKYTDDGGVFVRSIDARNKIIDEMYWQSLTVALEIGARNRPPNTDVHKYQFVGCAEAHYQTTLAEGFTRSLSDEYVLSGPDYPDKDDPTGFIWGVRYADAYPGLTYVENGERARYWSGVLGRGMHEVFLETNCYQLRLTFADLRYAYLGDESEVTLAKEMPLDVGESDVGQ